MRRLRQKHGRRRNSKAQDALHVVPLKLLERPISHGECGITRRQYAERIADSDGRDPPIQG